MRRLRISVTSTDHRASQYRFLGAVRTTASPISLQMISNLRCSDLNNLNRRILIICAPVSAASAWRLVDLARTGSVVTSDGGSGTWSVDQVVPLDCQARLGRSGPSTSVHDLGGIAPRRLRLYRTVPACCYQESLSAPASTLRRRRFVRQERGCA
jgi:hypothetical protein